MSNANEIKGRRLRLGMVGGGQGAFIGGVHRIAARLDDKYELVAGAFSSDADRALASAAELHIAPDRAYVSFEQMAKAEAAREDGIDVCAIVTPNHLHKAAAEAMLKAGIHVICEKPVTTTVDDANALFDLVEKTGLVFGLTHNYTGYPMVRHARSMVEAGDLGKIRVIQVEYPQDWLTTKEEDGDNKQAQWRTDPARSGVGGCVGDIGTHAYNLASFITGLEVKEVCADLSTFVDGRALDDNVNMMLRYEGGTRGMLWASQVAPGCENALKIRVFGENGGLFWEQEHPNQLTFAPFGQEPRIISRGNHGTGDEANRVTRTPAGHPEGYLEGFATIYSDIAELISARLENRSPDPLAGYVPTILDGVKGIEFIVAAVESSQKGSVWVPVGKPS